MSETTNEREDDFLEIVSDYRKSVYEFAKSDEMIDHDVMIQNQIYLHKAIERLQAAIAHKRQLKPVQADDLIKRSDVITALDAYVRTATTRTMIGVINTIPAISNKGEVVYQINFKLWADDSATDWTDVIKADYDAYPNAIGKRVLFTAPQQAIPAGKCVATPCKCNPDFMQRCAYFHAAPTAPPQAIPVKPDNVLQGYWDKAMIGYKFVTSVSLSAAPTTPNNTKQNRNEALEEAAKVLDDWIKTSTDYGFTDDADNYKTIQKAIKKLITDTPSSWDNFKMGEGGNAADIRTSSQKLRDDVQAEIKAVNSDKKED